MNPASTAAQVTFGDALARLTAAFGAPTACESPTPRRPYTAAYWFDPNAPLGSPHLWLSDADDEVTVYAEAPGCDDMWTLASPYDATTVVPLDCAITQAAARLGWARRDAEPSTTAAEWPR
mgnify:CR=1 FL=1